MAVIENSPSGEILHYSTCLQTEKKDDLGSRIYALGLQMEKILETHKPEAVAIETLFFNKNIKTGIGVAQARGAIMYIAKKFNCQIYEFGPQEIKIATTGYGKSDKNAVIAMVKRLVKNVPEDALDDEYDAIAVGITCLAHYAKGR